MDADRVSAVAASIERLGYKGIAKFDQAEPEYEVFDRLANDVESERVLALLGILAGTEDYQLAGDAQEFWYELAMTVDEYGIPDSAGDVWDILDLFLEADVNSRLNQQKRDRLERIRDAGFDDWFLESHVEAAPEAVWTELANALNTDRRKKTVVFAMKVYDIVHYITTGEYLEFSADVPIPCDLQVKRVAHTSGLTSSDDDDDVIAAWVAVAETVNESLERAVSLLRIDSIVWQSGQIIGEYQSNPRACRKELLEHFEEVGIGPADARALADELTHSL